MNCLANICYVCLEKNVKSLININSSLSVNKDIIHMIGYLPCNLAWLQTKRIILICDQCCLRLRDTDQFLTMCLKNSSLLKGYMDKINTASILDADNEAELRVDLNNEHIDINETKCEIKLEGEEMYTVESGPIIEESEYEFRNVHDSFVKEEDTWKGEEVDDNEESPMDNNYPESSDYETDSKISVNSNTHDTDTNFDSSDFTSTQVNTINKKKLNISAKKSHECLTCNKSFSTKTKLQMHTRVYTDEKPYKCAICEKCFTRQSYLVSHLRSHTGEKPHKCAICEKCFIRKSHLVRHMQTHTGDKPHKCTICEKCFTRQSDLVRHTQTHSGVKPYKCARCEKCFTRQSYLMSHLRTHTGVKPDE